ncbi:MAG: SH3 domain-containing protein [Candidatus Latescibacterota bacterium]
MPRQRGLSLCVGMVLLAGAAGAGPVLRMNRAQVNIRADATSQSALVAVLHAGEEAERTGARNEWLGVRLIDGRRGWVHSSLVQEVLVVTAQSVRIRAGASTAAPVVGAAAAGDELVQVQALGEWVEVGLPGGDNGWVARRHVRPKESGELASSRGRRRAAPVVEEGEDEAALARAPEGAEEAEMAAPVRPAEPSLAVAGGVRASPYARGLELAVDGDFAGALACFEQVLAADPNNLNALVNAAKAHRQLGEYAEAAEKLQQALAVGPGRREAMRDLADVYGLANQPDSAAKYEALSRGETWIPVEEQARGLGTGPRMGEWPRATLWVYGAAAGAVLLAALLLLLGLRRRRSEPAPEEEEGSERPRRRGFSRALQQSQAEGPPEGLLHAQTLERQIEAKKAQLRASSEAFLGTGGRGPALDPRATEERHLDRLLEQVDALRQALQMQEDRARLYAEVVQLQGLRLEAMSRELRLLRKQPRR